MTEGKPRGRPARTAPLGLRGYALGLAALWTLALGGSLGWGLWQERRQEMAAAAVTGRVSYEADVKYLSWLSALGGLYIRAADPIPPDPHLGRLADFKIRLTDGTDLMPVTPIYVLRLVHALDIEPLEISSRLRSLTPAVPDDVPDPWEERALRGLAAGRTEFAEVARVEGERCLRVMLPLRMGKDCVSCHSRQGYAEGTLQGGLSVTVPLDRPAEFGERSDMYLYAAHGMLWLLGLGFIGYGFRSLASSNRQRDAALRDAAAERAFGDSVLDTAGAILLVTDPTGRIVRFNRAFEEATGYRLHEVRGAVAWDLLLPPEDRPGGDGEGEGGSAGRDVRETDWIRKDGSRRTVAWAIAPLADDRGDVRFLISSGVDITERKQAEGALKQSEERYRTLVDHIDLGITLVDDRYRIVMANAAHGRMLQKHPSDEVGLECYRVVHGRDDVCPGCPGAKAMATGRPAFRETGGHRADGSPFWVRVQAFPVLGADGGARGFIEVVEDLTEAKRLRDERDQLEQKMLQAQKLESIGVLAGGIAHDFNNLLMGILGNVDLALLKSPPDSPVRLFLQRIELASQRAADLTNQLLAYSGKGRYVVEALDASRLVAEMEHLLQTVLAKTATVRYQLAPGLPPIEGDGTQLRQVVMNLITNASDALGGKAGVITVGTGVADAETVRRAATHFAEGPLEGSYVFVEVADTGCGMDAGTLARIFDPFFTTRETGRGLGLAAVAGIVRGHRGALEVSSEPGRGTTFRVYFRAGGAPGAPEASSGGPADHQGSRRPPRGTVLVVDDEEDVREVAKGLLESGGFEVLTAADGQEGLEIFRARAPEISAVVLDLTMPRLGGLETCREMRRLKPGVAVILSSGYTEKEAVSGLPGSEPVGFVHKPYRAKDLFEALEGALAQGPSA